MNRLTEIYENHFLQLRHLPEIVKDSTREIVFSYRNGVESICLFVSSSEVLSLLVKNLPYDFFQENYYKYGVDLESIFTSKIRIYRDDNDCSLVGHYIDEYGNILETKKYVVNKEIPELTICRYDSNNNLISSNEKEIETIEKNWKGSRLVTLLAKQHNLHTIYLKKVDKDQCYVRVRDI